ncbi:MAG: DUF4426 domain-containing protein [Cellvibrionaceae bacterium]
MRRHALGLVVCLGVMLAAASAGAQEMDQMKRFGDYRVYYSLINSTFLTPEIAERYNVERSEDLAVVMVSVRAPNEENIITAQPADVAGEATDLVRHYNLDFEEFRDPSAVYYIAEVPAQGRTKVEVSLDIKPHDSDQTFEVEISKMFYPRQP